MPYKYPSAEIIVFAREPVLGHVKTRLFPAIGKARALQLHCAMIRRVTQMVTASELAPLRLSVSSNIHHEVFLSCCNKSNISLQASGDLGAKMAQAAAMSLARPGVKSVLLIGADCPVIDAAYLELALSNLDAGGDVVVGPARDGGYVLLGLSTMVPPLFADIPWGTDQVSSRTIDRLRTNHITYSLLDTLWDVDRPDDLALLSSLQPELEY